MATSKARPSKKKAKTTTDKRASGRSAKKVANADGKKRASRMPPAGKKKARGKKSTTKSTRRSRGAKVVRPRRVVVVDGARTPFVRAFGSLMRTGTIELASAATAGLLTKTKLDPDHIDGVVWGGVILPGISPNIARELVLDLKLPPKIEGMTVTRACASGLQAVTTAAKMIQSGDADVIIAGGSDSTSNMEFALPQKAIYALAPLMFGKKKKSPSDLLSVLAQLMPISDVLPRKPRIAERSTGELMGEAAEKMAKQNGITRQAQDAFATRSHRRAADATDSGRLRQEIIPIESDSGDWIVDDELIRADTSEEKLSRLNPVFDRVAGTITAGTASPLTDGASAVLLMSEEKAKALKLSGLATVVSQAYVGVDPFDQLLIGPALAMPLALERAGLSLQDMDYIDIHEAFAAQVLSVIQALQDDVFAQKHYAQYGIKAKRAIGKIDESKLNVHGGSIALGHPFGATGARMVTTMSKELAASGKRYALLGICAAGGLGAAAVLERA